MPEPLGPYYAAWVCAFLLISLVPLIFYYRAAAQETIRDIPVPTNPDETSEPAPEAEDPKEFARRQAKVRLKRLRRQIEDRGTPATEEEEVRLKKYARLSRVPRPKAANTGAQ